MSSITAGRFLLRRALHQRSLPFLSLFVLAAIFRHLHTTLDMNGLSIRAGTRPVYV
jgi:hypothetical protein